MQRLAVVFGLVSTFLFPSTAGALTININPGATLAGNSAALAAFDRAAALWEAAFTDNISVNIDADLVNLGSNNIIGQAGSVELFAGYDVIRDQMVVDAANEPDNAIVAALPTAAQFTAFVPTGITLDGNISATKSNLKAMGFVGLDAQFGANDATIQFNTQFSFDFDNSDGVSAGLTDFETVAAHEIGHALGFISAVDSIDFLIDQGLTDSVSLNPLDLFRFGQEDPETVLEFTTFSRNLTPGVEAFFDDLLNEISFSTGRFNGDGRQASHWKDDQLTGTLLGVLDPTLGDAQVFPITPADLVAFDLIGWDLAEDTQTTGPVAASEPGALSLLLVGAFLLIHRRRRVLAPVGFQS